jgi:hypothetical protein
MRGNADALDFAQPIANMPVLWLYSSINGSGRTAGTKRSAGGAAICTT